MPVLYQIWSAKLSFLQFKVEQVPANIPFLCLSSAIFQFYQRERESVNLVYTYSKAKIIIEIGFAVCCMVMESSCFNSKMFIIVI